MRRLTPQDEFRGFPPEVFAWFAGLERDNSKAYFTATREQYERDVRGGLEALLDALSGEFGGAGGARVFRQQRDLRFSRDKSPYKTRTYGVVPSASPAGFYAELSSQGLYAGAGYHQLAADQLERYRAAVAAKTTGAQLAEAVAAAGRAGLAVAGESLKTAPRGFPRDHPRAALLRHKALFAGGRLAGERGIGRDEALAHVAGTWRAVEPLTAWLDAHVGASALPPDGRGRRP
jgi:uncharacterized protein (TIGR02453 family)